MRRPIAIRSLLAGLVLALGSADPAYAEELVLGMSAAFTGPTHSLGIECYRGARACFDDVNRQGGIRGRMVRIKERDDGYDPERALSNTEQLIKKDQVLLLFGYVGTPTVTRVLPLLRRYKVETDGDDQWQLFFPFTGAEVLRQPPYDSFVYNLRASYIMETQGLVNHFVAIGRKRIGVFYQNDVYGRNCWDGVRRALKSHKEKIAAEATYARGKLQFTDSARQQVEILRRASPDAIISVGSYGACAAFIRDARDAGWDVPIANVSFVGSEQMLALLKGAAREPDKYTRRLVNSQVVPSYLDNSVPAAAEYRAAMDRQPPLPEVHEAGYQRLDYGFVSFEGYLDAKVMVEILRRAGNDPSRRAVREVADNLAGFDLGLGPGASVSLRPGPLQGLHKVYFTVIENGRWAALADEDWGERLR